MSANDAIEKVDFRIVEGVKVESGIPLRGPRGLGTGGRGVLAKVLKNMRVGESFVCTRNKAVAATTVAKRMGLKVATRAEPKQKKVSYGEQKVRVFLVGPLNQSFFINDKTEVAR